MGYHGERSKRAKTDSPARESHRHSIVERGIDEGKILGRPLAISREGSLIAVTGENGQLSVYNFDLMRKIEDLAFVDQILLARFSMDGKRLFVLTAGQTAYFLEVSPSTTSDTDTASQD